MRMLVGFVIATEQVRSGDLIRVDFDEPNSRMALVRELEGMPTYAMVEQAGLEAGALVSAGVASAAIEPARPPRARSTRK